MAAVLNPEASAVAWSAPDHIGARLEPDGHCTFRVWAPAAGEVELELDTGAGPRRLAMPAKPRGYHALAVPGVPAGALYRFVLDGRPYPDPASRWQPQGPHGASAVLPHDFDWRDADWRGLPLDRYVLYELHIGTFTPEGTLDAACERLPELRELGITAVELMPLAEFPGTRNWGYDGASPFAVQSSYGGPQALRRFVDAAHRAGLAVVLDVVYNHLGPEGNYLSQFGPYFTDRYRTPWGDAVNFDGAHSDEVRAYFIANALHWIEDFHLDALRLDAVHAIFDNSAYPFLRELADTVRSRARTLGREVLLIAESDLGDPRMIRPGEAGGMHMHAQWADDFHHALHALLTGERQGYYADYGGVSHLARAFQQGFVYAGEFSEYRQRRHGAAPVGAAPEQLVVFGQNHDQVGNRLLGDRLSTLLDHESLKLLAASVLLSPFTPLLFMGEEYGERAPFPYFVSHTDPDLVAAVRRGRAEEFAAFGWTEDPPDPQSEETCSAAVLRWEQRTRGPHAELLRLHQDLLALREKHLDLLVHHETLRTRHGPEAGGDGVLQVLRRSNGAAALLLLNFQDQPVRASLPPGSWRVALRTADPIYGGPGQDDPSEPGAIAARSATLLLQRHDD